MTPSTRKTWFAAALAGSALCAPAGRVAAAEDPDKPAHSVATVLEALESLGPKPIEILSPAKARVQPSVADAVIQVGQNSAVFAPDKLPVLGAVELKSLPGPDGTRLNARVYTPPPPGTGPFPLIVYFHGGGWVLGSLDSHDAACRNLASANEAVVVSVDYRRAPEHKFPAATEDAYAALQYALEHAAELHGDPARVAVLGEGAGANLATVACLMAKERGGKMPAHQVLVYPVTNYGFNSQSYRKNAQARPLNTAMMKWFFKLYLHSAAEGKNVHVSPLLASTEQLRGLPPATIITATVDPLQDDGGAYARKLRAAGVNTEYKEYPGMTHEFFGMSPVVAEVTYANAFVKERLERTFEGKLATPGRQ